MNIFLSYRRSDTGDIVGRISDTITKYLPKANVFMDVEAISGGADFKTMISNSVQQSDIVLVLIGKGWIVETADSNRLFDQEDFVRLEVEQALAGNAKVFPILINDAEMPSTSDLPEAMHPLCYLNALEVRHSRYQDDMKRCLQDVFKLQEKDFSGHTFFDKGKTVLAGILSGFILLIIVAVVHDLVFGKGLSSTLGTELTTLLIIITPVLGIGYFWQRWIK